MRLVVKQNDSTISEFRFAKGPIYIGRHRNSQIFLQHRAVSRQHAVIYQQEDEQWLVEDLDSPNKTYLNDEAIHRSELKTGDVIRVVDFSIEVNVDEDEENAHPMDMEDTFTKTAYNLESSLVTGVQDVVIRKPEAEQAPGVQLPAQSLMDLAEAAEIISDATNPDELVLALLNVVLKQFDANRVWCALRMSPAGPMTAHAGKGRDGKPVEVETVKLKDKITQAVDRGQYMVMPGVASEGEDEEPVGSAMIAPILRPSGCFGVVYVDNEAGQGHFGLSELDHLTMLTIHTAGTMRKL
jgi:predicted component of type VI protein secretion system